MTELQQTPNASIAQTGVPPSSAFNHPDDVARDGSLSMAQKRALLASWISDARAVENAPALRQIDSGAIVSVDDIRQALHALDGEASSSDARLCAFPPFGRRGWRARGAFWRRPESPDDDDDPPPVPTRARVPAPPPPADVGADLLRRVLPHRSLLTERAA